ncbi:ribonuclease FAU-1 family protein [Stetteria hydrogenophila]
MPGYGVRVRGVYATALAVLFRERGFELADVSDVLKSRLGIEGSGRAPEVTVKSLDDSPDEVLVLGYPWEAGVEAERAILEAVGYASVVRGRLGLYTVVDAVSLGGCRLRLPGGVEGRLDARECPPEGVVVRGTVVREAVEPGGEVVVRGDVRLVGPHVVVSAPGRGVSFSEHLRREEERAPLLAAILGRVDVNEVHVHFRSAARLADPEAVAVEALELARRAVQLHREGPGGGEAIVTRGEYVSIIYLPRPAKEELDRLRASVSPTVEGHHSLKAGGREESMMVDVLEEALAGGACTPRAGRVLEASLARRLQGRRVMVDHRRPDRSVTRLGPFTVSRVEASGGRVEVVLERVFTAPGVLDGLGVEKKPGDRAVTRLSTDSWIVLHEYVSSDGRPLGFYANVNTPPEVSSRGFRYLDLYVDVVKRPGEPPRIVDAEELEEARSRGLITEGLYERALREAERAAGILEGLP